MNKEIRIFICNYGYTNSWIMGKIADDIQQEATKLGLKCRQGAYEDYDNEDICYHLNHHIAAPFKNAKHNSVFYTHLNDSLQEKAFYETRDHFDSYICMSPEDAQYLIELGFPKEKVHGRILPIRNSYIKPLSVGIFSRCYPDGRKNEKWLLDYCATNEEAKNVNFVFLGDGWGKTVDMLNQIGCSFEWHYASRNLPYEYQFQQNKLAALDYYIYMGMDGGAMGTYDAYAQNVPLCVTFDGFHKAIPYLDYSFDNEETFKTQFDSIVKRHAQRLSFFKNNTTTIYFEWLFGVWNGKDDEQIKPIDKECLSFSSVVEKKRKQYYPIGINSIKKAIVRLFLRKKYSKMN